MAIARSSSRCFDAASNALQAVKYGKASEAETIFRSVKNDAMLMQNELRKYHQTLQRTERQYENKAERLTGEINQLYQREQEMRKQERQLTERTEQLRSQNQINVESRNEAERKHRQASDEEQRARERKELHEKLYWIPIVNIFAAIVNAIEENGAKAREARADIERYQRRIDEENDDIRTTNSRIKNIQAQITEAQRKAQSLHQQRDSSHNELGAVKSIIVFVLEASTVSSMILNLTEGATVKAEDLETIMRLAAKKNTLKILQSGGIKTKVGSFKECFDEIADMMQSNSLLFLEEELHLGY